MIINHEMACRDWLAGQALLGLLLRHSGEILGGIGAITPEQPVRKDPEIEALCFKAYQIADAMVGVSEKTKD